VPVVSRTVKVAVTILMAAVARTTEGMAAQLLRGPARLHHGNSSLVLDSPAMVDMAGMGTTVHLLACRLLLEWRRHLARLV
jgi:hypothetical protein